MIELREEGHQIQSFTDANVYYIVKQLLFTYTLFIQLIQLQFLIFVIQVTSDDTFIISYTYADFTITQQVCKHIFAIKIIEPELSIPLLHHTSIMHVLEDDAGNSNIMQTITTTTTTTTTETTVFQQMPPK